MHGYHLLGLSARFATWAWRYPLSVGGGVRRWLEIALLVFQHVGINWINQNGIRPGKHRPQKKNILKKKLKKKSKSNFGFTRLNFYESGME